MWGTARSQQEQLAQLCTHECRACVAPKVDSEGCLSDAMDKAASMSGVYVSWNRPRCTRRSRRHGFDPSRSSGKSAASLYDALTPVGDA